METRLRMLRDTPVSVCLVADDDQTASGEKNVFTGPETEQLDHVSVHVQVQSINTPPGNHRTNWPPKINYEKKCLFKSLDCSTFSLFKFNQIVEFFKLNLSSFSQVPKDGVDQIFISINWLFNNSFSLLNSIKLRNLFNEKFQLISSGPNRWRWTLIRQDLIKRINSG